MKKVILSIFLSLSFTSSYAAEAAKLDWESTRMTCQSQDATSFSIVKAKFKNQDEALFVKIDFGFSNVPNTYQKLVLTKNLNDRAYIYESADFTFTTYSFASGKKAELATKDNALNLKCNSVAE